MKTVDTLRTSWARSKFYKHNQNFAKELSLHNSTPWFQQCNLMFYLVDIVPVSFQKNCNNYFLFCINILVLRSRLMKAQNVLILFLHFSWGLFLKAPSTDLYQSHGECMFNFKRLCMLEIWFWRSNIDINNHSWQVTSEFKIDLLESKLYLLATSEIILMKSGNNRTLSAIFKAACARPF